MRKDRYDDDKKHRDRYLEDEKKLKDSDDDEKKLTDRDVEDEKKLRERCCG